MDLRALGHRLTLTGALSQVAGLAVDLWRHGADPSLAAREELLTSANAGHVLLIAGIALVVAGCGLTLAGTRRVTAAAVVAVVLAGAAVAAGQASLSRGHGDAHARPAPPAGAAPHVPAGNEASPQPAAGVPPAPPGHGHGDGTVEPNQPLDAATRGRLATEIVAARSAAARYPTVADATRDGYRMVTRYIPRIGAHYMNFSLVDGVFDVERPEMLLYDGTGPQARIVGLSYFVRSVTEPDGFEGPNDRWHRHLGLCVDPVTLVVIGSGATSEEECRRQGGFRVDGSDGWMVHAWVVPGWESPQGVFSAENQDLR